MSSMPGQHSTTGEPRETPSDGGRADFYAGASAGATALIVDDDSDGTLALRALLERGGMTALAASSGPAALNLLDARGDIGIVLMDIMMPVMDGYETMTAIRSRPSYVDLPIIAVTGKDVEGERERCLAAGASDYVPKPINTPRLLTAICEWLPGGAPLQSLRL